MRTYLVNIQEHFSKCVLVKAPNAGEAERLCNAALYGDLKAESCDLIKFDYRNDTSDMFFHVVEEISPEEQEEYKQWYDTMEHDPEKDDFKWKGN